MRLRGGATKHVVVIGGGIAGLATAFYLQYLSGGAIDVTLVEESQRAGGKITSVHEAGFVIEGGPDSFLASKTATQDLCRILRLGDQLVPSNAADRTPTYVWSRGRLHPMPEGMMLMAPTMVVPFLRSRLISFPGKLRMGIELLIPPRANNENDDESMGSFVRRRLGAEALDKIAAPLMAGIYAADPETLSLRSTFPMFPEMERRHGGLLRGLMKQKRSRGKRVSQQARPPMFMTLRGGLQQLVNAILAQLRPESILLGRRVTTVTCDQGVCEVALNDGRLLCADEVVFATPAHATADLVQEIDPALATQLREIRYVSTATVSLGFKLSDIARPLDGFGFVVPHSENRRITACSWSSAKFNHRAPGDCALIRVFVGGARAERLAEMDAISLVKLARQELSETMGITAEPVITKVFRWYKANPQYEVGHRVRITEIDRIVASHPGLHLAGAAYHGAGIPDCIRSGARIAQMIARKYSIDRSEAYGSDF